MAEVKKERAKEQEIAKMLGTFDVLHRDLKNGAFADKIFSENVSIITLCD